MTTIDAVRTVTVERDIPHPPAKVWRALTLPHFIEDWLMKTDFAAVIGQRFQFRADWGAVDGEVLAIEPERSLAYRWDAMGLESIVTWTLTPTAGGTRLRMDQTGFRADQEQAFQGAKFGWAKFLGNLEQLLGRID